MGWPRGRGGTLEHFINTFGLNFAPSYNGVWCACAPVSSHPLLASVSSIYFNNGNDVNTVIVTNPAIAQVLFSFGGHGLLAVSAIGSVSANAINEGQSATLDVTLTDPSVLDTRTVVIN